jgi:hypothetical protein
MSTISSYRNSTSESARILKSRLLVTKYPNNIPVILEKSSTDKILPDITKTKYIMPKDMTVSNIIQILRTNMKGSVNEYSGIYLICDENIMLSGAQSVEYLYNNYKNKDGFLYIQYCGENVFG